MELIRLKSRIRLANKGLSLLKRKRAALIVEFFKINRKALDLRKKLKQVMDRSYNSLKVAEMYHGRITLESVAYRATRMKGLSITTRNVMGVKIPEIAGRDEEYRVMNEQYALVGLSVKTENAMEGFAEALRIGLDIAEVENTLR